MTRKDPGSTAPSLHQGGNKHNRWKRFWVGVRDIKPQMLIAFLSFIIVYAALFLIGLLTPALRDAIQELHVSIRVALSLIFALGFIAGGYGITMLFYLFFRRRKPRSKYMIEVVTVAVVFLVSWILKAAVQADVSRAIYETETGLTYNPSFSEITGILLSSFYGALGGLSFEGLAQECISTNLLYISFYYGSSIVTALIFVSVVASKAAYEFFSRIMLFFLKTDNKEIYVFTALNDETLSMASSLVDEDAMGDAHRKLIIFSGSALEPFDRHDPRCVEVLSHGFIYWSVSAKKDGTILQQIGLKTPKHGAPKWKSVTVFAFDSDNDHIPNEEENMDYVLLDVHNRIVRIAEACEEKVEATRRYFRALEKGDDLDYVVQYEAALKQDLHRFEQQKQSALARIPSSDPHREDRAFEAEHRLERHRQGQNHLGDAHISYYILTKRKIDYQAYQDKISSLEKDYRGIFEDVDAPTIQARKALRDEQDKDRIDELRAAIDKRFLDAIPFSIHVWNESDAIAREAQDLALDDEERCLPQRDQTWVWSIGYGTTAQNLVKTCYRFSASQDEKGNASAFLCDVFDPASQDLAGMNRLEIPLSVNLINPASRAEIPERFREEFNRIVDTAYTAFCDRNYGQEGFLNAVGEYPYYQNGAHAYTEETLATLKPNLKKELPVPCFVFHDCAAGGEAMWDLLQSKGEKPAPSRSLPKLDLGRNLPDYIVVAVGDDNENIRIANDLVRYLLSNKMDAPLTIFVNVWDEKNNNLVFGFNNPSARGKHPQVLTLSEFLRVIIMGNNEDIYRCKNILEDTRAIHYNYVYSRVSSGDPKAFEAFQRTAHLFYKTSGDFHGVSSFAEASLDPEVLAKPWSALSQAEQRDARCAWLGASLWNRISSAEAERFGPIFRRHLKDKEADAGALYASLVRLEHQRWMRVHIADGWTYAPRTDKGLRQHSALVPMPELNYATLAYDLFNVLLADTINEEA